MVGGLHTSSHGMQSTRFPRLTRILVLLAMFQAIAPSVAAIADAWRMDERTPYAHVESETGKGCVLVHQHDCALCSVATTPAAAPSQAGAFVPACVARAVARAAREVPHSRAVPRLASQRAPPVARG